MDADDKKYRLNEHMLAESIKSSYYHTELDVETENEKNTLLLKVLSGNKDIDL